jgi:hypothetical protein
VAESGAKESQISKYMEPDCMASPIVNQWIVSGYATGLNNVGNFKTNTNKAKGTSLKGSFNLK